MNVSVKRHLTTIQQSTILLGSFVSLYRGRAIRTAVPPIDAVPPEYISPQLYEWMSVQIGVGLVVFGLALRNQNAVRRFPVLRLSRLQRNGLRLCALALLYPWFTTFFVGPVLEFRSPFMPIWFVTFLWGFAGFGGVVTILCWRLVERYLRLTSLPPYVRVDATRRSLLRAGGATILGSSTIGVAVGAGPLPPNGPTDPAYLGRAPIVYERDDLQLLAHQPAVRRGESIVFEMTNTGDADAVPLGCNNTWAIQAYEDGEWHHVVWTGGRASQLCYSALPPGETTTETVPLEPSALSESLATDDVPDAFPAGTYRFVALGSEPFLAVNFQVLPVE